MQRLEVETLVRHFIKGNPQQKLVSAEILPHKEPWEIAQFCRTLCDDTQNANLIADRLSELTNILSKLKKRKA
jgi:hypothetical protein